MENWGPEGPPPFIQNIFRVVDETIFPSCACIMHAKGTENRGHRSGVFVQVADKRFLVTAAHHLIALHNEGVGSFLVLNEKGSHPVFIHTETWYTTVSEQEDLAVCQLDENVVDYIGEKHKYLRVTDFLPKRLCGDGFYIIVGFPLARIGPDEDGITACAGWKYVSRRFEKTEVVENYDPNVHLVVKYERESNDGERIVHPPAMSGCGIWYLGKEPPEVIFPGDLKLCAIENAWSRPKEYAKGTWTDIVLKIIWKYYPDVRPAMRLHGCSF